MTTRDRIIIGVLMLVVLATFMDTGSPVLLLLLILMLMSFLRRGGDKGRRSRVRSADHLDDEELFNEYTVRPERTSYSEHIHQHAIRAVHAAGHDPDDLPVLPVDLGVIVFSKDEPPAVYRTNSLPDEADYVQPFIELRVPVDATGKVRFEMLDSQGTPIFIHEDFHNLRRGRNLISPSARLPIHDELELDGPWQLRVYADGVVLVAHPFSWEPLRDRADQHIRKHIVEDGEISSELRAILTESRLQPLSLDELLAAQEEAEQEQRR